MVHNPGGDWNPGWVVPPGILPVFPSFQADVSLRMISDGLIWPVSKST